jgi:hypothetical protein
MTIPNNFTASQPLTEEQESMMSMLLDHAKKIREGYGYSGEDVQELLEKRGARPSDVLCVPCFSKNMEERRDAVPED